VVDSGTEPQRVFVELLGEGTTCLRPTLATPLGDGTYRLLPTPDYDPQDEHWAFPPGSIVRCRREWWSGTEVLVARVQ
jgi:hypothetical protein